MTIEKVTSPNAETWMHLKRMNHGQVKEWLKANKDDPASASTRIVASCLCEASGKPYWPSTEDALKAIDQMDWQLVREISEQAFKVCGFDLDVEEAEKNS